jgi:phytoene synthase
MAPPATLAPKGSLEASYRRCRALAKRHGTTYYLSTFLLPREAWRHVWALYAFCRLADEIVDEVGPMPVSERERALGALRDRFFADLASGTSDEPVLRAVVATVRTHGIDPDCFRRFLASMAMDLTVTSYATWDDLLVYMDGSAAVIGEMMLPILDPTGVDAVGPARDLGLAFQLTNFLRDVAEDLDRGRVYLPQADLVRFGADPARRRVDGTWRRLMAFEIDRCRALYRSADEGLEQLPPASARCVRSARVLYAGILDRIEAAGYDVFTRRARVPAWRKLTTVVSELAAGLPPGGRPSPRGR